MSRIAFGIHGAQMARVMVIALWPSLKPLDTNSILGLSTLGWLTFLVLWIIQVIIVRHGMDLIRKYEAFSGPIILVTMLALAISILSEANWSLALSTSKASAVERPTRRHDTIASAVAGPRCATALWRCRPRPAAPRPYTRDL